jgi:methionine-rich copper-binding protein CopC
MTSRTVIGAVVAIALTAGSASVAGHAKLEKSEPAAAATVTTTPAHLQLWFNEKPDLKVTKITLSGPAGQVEVGPAHSKGEKTIMTDITGKMPDGKYSVSWQTAGKDGHVQKGTFAFNLKHAK